MRRAAVAVMVVGALVSGCGDDDGPGSSETASSNTLTVREVEYGYELSGEPKAGVVTFAVENAGDELHMFGACRLRDGRTVDDVRRASERGDEDALGAACVEGDTIDRAGGVQAPGVAYDMTVDGLASGEYAAICFLPDEDGTLHAALGMVAGFTIGDGDEGDIPDADVTFETTGTKTTGPTTLDAGRTSIRVEGGENDEVIVVKIKDGKTPSDLDAYFKTLDEGASYDKDESPAEFVFLAFASPEARWFTIDLTAGQWAINISDEDADTEDVPSEKDPHVLLFDVE